MKILRNICYAVSLLTLGVGMTACDYLDVVPPETATSKDAMRDKNDALGFLYSCYANTRISEACNSMAAVESSTDEYANPELWARLNQQTAWNQLSATYTSNWTVTDLPWTFCYGSIGQCHLFDQTLDNSKLQGVTDEDRAQWKAEVEFLLAYYHFRLLRAYGPIPIIDHFYPETTSKNELPGRSHFDYCVDRIVAWLDDAAKVLPATRETEDLGRATSTACLAMKARVLVYAASPLWNGSFPFPNWKNTNYETPGYGKELVSLTYSRDKWVRAEKACQEALSLALGEGHRALFDLKTSETLRAMQQIALPNIPGVSDDFKKKVMQMRYLMSTSEVQGNTEVIWGVLTDPLNTHIAEVLPHLVVVMNDGMAYGGGNGAAPLLYAVEHFYTKNGKLPEKDLDFSKSEWFKSAGYSGRENIIKLNDQREPRFYANISFDGDEYSQRISNGDPLILEMRNSAKQGYNPIKYNRDNSVTGYCMKKFAKPSLVFRKDGSHNRDFVPTPFYRLSELYLNLAECEAMLDETSLALENLNVIRTRAGIPDVKESDLNDLSLIEWIRNERFVELYAEGHRYYDARRWMIAPQLFKSGAREGLNALQKMDPTFEEFNQPTVVDQPFQWDDRMYLLPININELYSDPQLIQSPKY